mmetsp:Transcript_6526/g.9483  ORF Transcript_6526/g.9483 Transcript_6526/m.9483 type:complete len:905 (+) Transcript_6526:142-2856(+)
MKFSKVAVTTALASSCCISYVNGFGGLGAPSLTKRLNHMFPTVHRGWSVSTIDGDTKQSKWSLRASEEDEIDVIASAIASVDGILSEANGDTASSITAAPDAAADDGDDEAPGTTPATDGAVVEEIHVPDENSMENLLSLPVPPKGYSIESTGRGPNSSMVHTLTVNLGVPGHPEPIIIETGKIGRQAAGAVTVTRGEDVIYSTAAFDNDPKEQINFLPLSVEYQERFSSVGTTSGGYNKRDGRPAEHEILTCRLIDRPIRPLIKEGWKHETQLLTWVLSHDNVRDCDSLAVTASAAALSVSDVPMMKPVAAVSVGYVDGHLVVNPTKEQMDRSRLNLTVAGTKDAVLMIEGAADFLPESLMVEAVTMGQEAIGVICDGLSALGEVVGREPKLDTISAKVEGLMEAVEEYMTERVDQSLEIRGKKTLEAETKSMYKDCGDAMLDRFPVETHGDQVPNMVKAALKKLISDRMYYKAKTQLKRMDGRDLHQVRHIDIETSLLPRVHGSALFTRGETQTIATATLGDSGMRQKIDTLEGTNDKRFYLQYTFPPSCVGETGRVGMPGRREVGHGNLAERAILPALPSEDEFPYTLRVESLITESHGSSSMASVCGGILALMDAGVPIKRPVAGIAMGMLLDDTTAVSDENAVIVSDILGNEDALGTMDFKVAGDKEGITAFQLDIKCEGLSVKTLERALEQARQGRLHILNEMAKTLEAPRDRLPDTVPKLATFQIAEDTIGRVIGPGGKQIRAIIDDFHLTNMNVGEEGIIQMSSMDAQMLQKAEAFVNKLVSSDTGRGAGRGGGAGGRPPKVPYAGPPPEVGKIYNGKITGIHQFGVFLEILPGAEDGSYPGLEGLCHVSELHTERVRNCEGFVNSMNTEAFEVKFLGINDKGKVQLSRRAAMQEK